MHSDVFYGDSMAAKSDPRSRLGEFISMTSTLLMTILSLLFLVESLPVLFSRL